MLNLILSLIGIFALIVVVGRLMHRYFVYIPDRNRVAPKDVGLPDVQEVTFKGTGGVTLRWIGRTAEREENFGRCAACL